MNAKMKIGKHTGDSLLMLLSKMKYFRWNRDGYFEQFAAPSAADMTTEEYIKERDTVRAEQILVKSVIPFVQWYTAEDKNHAEGIIENTYGMVCNVRDRELRQAGIVTAGDGFKLTTSPDEKIESYENFRKFFIAAAAAIEKVYH